MIKLPDETALGSTPSGNSGRPIATIDTSAIGRGVEQLGEGLQQAGGAALSYAATHQEEAEKQQAWDAATKWNDIQTQQKIVAQGMADQMQPGGVGTMDAFTKQYKEATGKFYSSLPPRLAGQYRAQIHDYAGTLSTVLNGAVIKEQGRFAGVQQDTMNNQFINNADPNDPKATADKINAYTLANPNLSPIDKQTRIANTPNTVAVGVGNAILGSKETMRPIFQPGSGIPSNASAHLSALDDKYGLPAGYLARTMQIESGGKDVANKLGSGAQGPFQFIPSTAARMGVDPHNFASSSNGAARLAQESASILRSTLGREPTAGELYLAHQQGAEGASKLLANPNASAASIVGTKAVIQNGGTQGMSAGDFANMWMNKFNGSKLPAYAQAATAQGGGVTQQDPYSQARTYFQGKFGDTVDPSILNQLANAAVSKWNAYNQETRTNIQQALSDAPAAIANTGQYTGYRPSEQDFSDAYGREGGQRYSEFQQSMQVAQTTHNISTLPQDQVQAQVDQARAKVEATTGLGAEQAAKDYDAVAKAAAATLKARNDDAAGYVQQAFPAVKGAWDNYRQSPTGDNMAVAITATQAAQEQLNIPVQNRNVLPSQIVDDFIARQKLPNRTTEQNMQDLAGTVFATNNPDQQEAIFNQLKRAGVPAEAETVLRAYSRDDKASARFLASVIDAKGLPEKKEQGADTIPNAVDVAMTASDTGVAQTLYGLDIGQEGNLETYTNDRNVFIKAVKVKMLEGLTQDAAITFAQKALYGDARVVDQGNAKIVLTGKQDGDAIVNGLSHQMDSVRAALQANGEVDTNGATPDERNSKAVIQKLSEFKVNDVLNTGEWRNLGAGFGFVDKATGLFVSGKDSKPLIVTPDRAEADGNLYSAADATVRQNKQDVKPTQNYMDELQKKKDEAVRTAPAFRPSPAIAPLAPGMAPEVAPQPEADPTVAPGLPAPSDVLPGTPPDAAGGDGMGGSGVGM